MGWPLSICPRFLPCVSWSSNYLVLEVPKSRSKRWGEQDFAVAAPRLWNKLPPDIHTITDVTLFRSKLKTYLVSMAFDTQQWCDILLWQHFSDFSICLFCLWYVVLYLIFDVKYFGYLRVVVKLFTNSC